MTPTREHKVGEFVANYDELTPEQLAMEPNGMADIIENSRLVSTSLICGTTIEFDEDGDVKQCEYANSYRAIIEALQIAARYQDNGLDSMGLGAEHDEIYLYLGAEQVEPDSDDGFKLQRLGFHYDRSRDSWIMYT